MAEFGADSKKYSVPKRIAKKLDKSNYQGSCEPTRLAQFWYGLLFDD